jgi:uncharacterized membrane protein YbhN (UPF0104 family)
MGEKSSRDEFVVGTALKAMLWIIAGLIAYFILRLLDVDQLVAAVICSVSSVIMFFSTFGDI